MVPQKIQSYFLEIFSKSDGENVLIEGDIICCNSHEFEVRVMGNVKQGLFSGQYIQAESDALAIELRCKKCGEILSVFNSNYDGYDRCIEQGYAKISPRRFLCRKCSESDFSVRVKYEYPSVEELDELDILEKNNAFTWIWVSLGCNSCGMRYSKFVDYETA